MGPISRLKAAVLNASPLPEKRLSKHASSSKLAPLNVAATSSSKSKKDVASEGFHLNVEPVKTAGPPNLAQSTITPGSKCAFSNGADIPK